MMWRVAVRERDKSGNIRWYCLEWRGENPLPYLHDGRTMGSYRYKRDTLSRADALNEQLAASAWHVG